MIKRPRKNYQTVANFAHRGFVFASIIFTSISTVFIGMRFYAHLQDRKAKKILSESQNNVDPIAKDGQLLN